MPIDSSSDQQARCLPGGGATRVHPRQKIIFDPFILYRATSG
jgi:hypothetical protein